jgi:hypothetical protein
MEVKLNEGFRGAFLDKWGYGVVSGMYGFRGAGLRVEVNVGD